MTEIGRLCVKLAGRDAGKKCVVVDDSDKTFVLIDGETRRRKCNVAHLEPLPKTLKVSKNASHEKVAEAFKSIGLKARETKPKKASSRPKRQKKVKKTSSEGSTNAKKKASSGSKKSASGKSAKKDSKK